ncbi:hypothetical protein PPERSA_04256 [Pseudocohnilembus persalinus]|uniref:Uncharacterized protein n=1 Tax=Pseudocohnilembus persalinus TaxID=266149 RepID=A0A0V0QNE6_PSEPJ|nr:hypothetical protein PPERSA_04256 [Pseudocohnilembus persalinus]|eukprot:KRX03748.1 hypothetical protein PPERSA_04256 [Pseudocohnilembus persalinus]
MMKKNSLVQKNAPLHQIKLGDQLQTDELKIEIPFIENQQQKRQSSISNALKNRQTSRIVENLLNYNLDQIDFEQLKKQQNQMQLQDQIQNNNFQEYFKKEQYSQNSQKVNQTIQFLRNSAECQQKSHINQKRFFFSNKNSKSNSFLEQLEDKSNSSIFNLSSSLFQQKDDAILQFQGNSNQPSEEKQSKNKNQKKVIDFQKKVFQNQNNFESYKENYLQTDKLKRNEKNDDLTSKNKIQEQLYKYILEK